MKHNPIKLTFVIGFIVLGLANLLVSVMTLFVKAGKYGMTDLWQNPDSFAIGTGLIALICFAVSAWFYRKN